MKKIIILPICLALTLSICFNSYAKADNITKVANSLGIDTFGVRYTTYWKPILQNYTTGNYLGAIALLNPQVKKDGDTISSYLYALCLHNLGYLEDAKMEYTKIIEANENSKYAKYSLKAISCMDNPRSKMCTGKEEKPQLTEMEMMQQARIKQLEEELKQVNNSINPPATKVDDDITQFIKSKNKIHPAAMDRITTERMERELQESEYKKRQQEQQQ